MEIKLYQSINILSEIITKRTIKNLLIILYSTLLNCS